MSDLLDHPYDFAIRIHPYRKTDFGHWRDSLNRSLSNQMKEALKAQTLSDAQAEEVAKSLDELKGCFPNSSAPAGEPLVLIRRADGALAFEYKVRRLAVFVPPLTWAQGDTLGIVSNRWSAKHLLLAYFADKNTISQKLKDSVAEGFEELLSTR
jgi:hypothetical protein